MDPGILDLLERQNRDAERLLRQLARSKAPHVQQPLVNKFRRIMTEHMRIDEADVYPELNAVAIDMGIEAEIEHDLIRKAIQQLDDMVGRPGFKAAVAMVMAGVGHHVEEEEWRIFPRLRKTAVDGPERLTRDDLYGMAKERGIPGRSAMSKDELLNALTHSSTIA